MMLVCGLFLALSVLITAGSGGKGSEPTFKGKPLSFWLQQYQSTDISIEPAKVAANKEAEMAVRAIGTNAIPALLEMAATSGPLSERDLEATDGFEILGSSASNAVPALLKLFERSASPSVQATAAWALAGIGRGATAAIPALLVEATNSDTRVRSFAFIILAKIPASNKQAVPLATQALGDTNLLVKKAAMVLLASCGSGAGGAVSALVEQTTNANWRVRYPAVEVLGTIHSIPNKAVPALVARLADPVPFVRKAAAWALGDFGGSAKEAVPALQHLLNDTNPDVRLAAAEAMKKIIRGNADDAQPDSRRPHRKSKSEEK